MTCPNRGQWHVSVEDAGHVHMRCYLAMRKWAVSAVIRDFTMQLFDIQPTGQPRTGRHARSGGNNMALGWFYGR